MIICSTLAGFLVNLLGVYTPFMFLGSALLTIGSGLCTTLQGQSGPGKWIGYQAILGLGAGIGFQQCIIAMQTVLPMRDVPIGMAIITFSQSLSAALFISIAQNVFQNRLVASLTEFAPRINPGTVVQAGAANLSQCLPPQIVPSVLYAYNVAVTQIFYVSVAAAVLSFVGAALVEQKSIRQPRTDGEVDVAC